MAAELQKTGMPYTFVDGIDGRDLDLTDPKVIDDPAAYEADWFRPGLIGASFSHLRACEQILKDDLDWALVLEDDARLPKDLVSLTESVAEHMSGAEIAVLCPLGPAGTGKLSRRGSVRLPASRQLVFPVNVNELGGGAAYLITREACKRMMPYIGPFRSHPDDWGFWFNEGVADRVRCVMPAPVYQDPAFVSAIQYHDQNGLKARVLDAAQRYHINFLNQLIVYRRSRILRNQAKFELVDEPFVVNPSRLD